MRIVKHRLTFNIILQSLVFDCRLSQMLVSQTHLETLLGIKFAMQET